METMPRPVTLAAIALTLFCGINRTTFAAVLNEGSITTSSSASTSLSSDDIAELPCNFATLASQRSMWASEDDSCNKKLPFDLWIIMKAEGTANDPDALGVEEHCLQDQNLSILELITPEDWDASSLDEAPGKVLSETLRTATLAYSGPLDLEAMCADPNIVAVNVVDPKLEAKVASLRRSRKLQATISEAVLAHKVPELIQGLQNLGCTRTNGEDTTLCVMTDSYNRNGQAPALEASGDLPPVTVVKELPEENTTAATDEGSAMIEVAFDIASGANYKFNTASVGETTFADDIGVLGGAEGCDVIVDDVTYVFSPAFRDGPIATAADAVSDTGVLFFSSSGNYGSGLKFTGFIECSTFLSADPVGTCDQGQGTLVWDVAETDAAQRYLLEIEGADLGVDTTLVLQWDDDDFAARDLNFLVIQTDFSSGIVSNVMGRTQAGRATAFFELQADAELVYSVAVVQYDSAVESIEMRLQTVDNFALFAPTVEGGSMFGQACAAKTLSVAAIEWDAATGTDGAFADPETASVADYSSRGPCTVKTGESLEIRVHPVTTAASKLTTSTTGFAEFIGTSASAPVAAAIATLIRAACFPKVVTYSDMIEILTNYDYIIDVTSDAGGAPETFGVEAGYGAISADQMLAWVAANCQESCSGASSPPTMAPNETAPTTTLPPTTAPPTMAPNETAPPTTLPPTTAPPTMAPNETAPPTSLSPTTAPETTVPPITAPPAITPPTTAPPTTAPPTTAPPTTAPPITVPAPTFVPPPTAPPVPTGTCSNGVPGVEGFGECCVLGCGTCGGVGCRRRALLAGLEGEDCCVMRIRESGVNCEDSGTAPCRITSADPSLTPSPVSSTTVPSSAGTSGST